MEVSQVGRTTKVVILLFASLVKGMGDAFMGRGSSRKSLGWSSFG